MNFKGEIPLSGAKIELIPEKVFQRTFCILISPDLSLLKSDTPLSSLKKTKAYVVACGTEDNMKAWYEHITKASHSTILSAN